jgi:hypothetical protein
MKTSEWVESLEDLGPPVGETAAEMMGTMNRVIRHLCDQRQEYLETTEGLPGGACFKEDFQGNWSNVKYSRHVAANQDTYDQILRDQGADHLVDSAIQPGVATPAQDAWAQTRALVKGVAEIATKLNTAGFHYKARNRSRTWKLDHGWYPTDIANKSKNPEHAMRKLTRPYQWLRREAISNLRIMQALGRP